jgi:hypothetical protein
MRDRFSKMTIVIAAAAVSGVMPVSVTRTSAQAPAGSSNAPMPSSALKAPRDEPDFQGIWTDEMDALAAPRQIHEPGVFLRGNSEPILIGSDQNCSTARGVRIGARTWHGIGASDEKF